MSRYGSDDILSGSLRPPGHGFLWFTRHLGLYYLTGEYIQFYFADAVHIKLGSPQAAQVSIFFRILVMLHLCEELFADVSLKNKEEKPSSKQDSHPQTLDYEECALPQSRDRCPRKTIFQIYGWVCFANFNQTFIRKNESLPWEKIGWTFTEFKRIKVKTVFLFH